MTRTVVDVTHLARSAALALMTLTLITSGCAHTSGIPTAPLQAPRSVVDGVEQAARGRGVVRWSRQVVSVSVSGPLSDVDSALIDASLVQMTPLTGVAFERVASGGDIDMEFAPRSEWLTSDNSESDLDPSEDSSAHVEPETVLGLTRSQWRDGSLVSSKVWIATDEEQPGRSQAIAHELYHAMGLGHLECPSSLVHGGAQGSRSWEPIELDRQVLSTWYDPGLRAGTSPEELPGAFEATPGGPPCETNYPVSYRSGGEVLWCDIQKFPAPCVAVDGQGALPWPVQNPTHWVADEMVYDYDPSIYQAFTFEGRRLLCVLGEDSRRPCTYTTGSFVDGPPDAWTDGQFVYQSK